MKRWLAKREGPLLILATALVLALGFLLPDAVARLQDAALRGRGAEVPPFFSAESAALPLVQAFWRREYFYGQDAYSLGTAEEPSEEPSLSLKQLREAGAMTGELYRAALEMLAAGQEAWDRRAAEGTLTAADGPAWRNDGPLGFTRLSLFGCDMERWEDTVVSLNLYLPYGASMPAAPDVDCGALLDAYLAYCGLDALEDWQALEQPAVAQCSERMLYSPSAQMYALVQLDARTEGMCRFALRLAWLGRDAAEEYTS